MEDTDLHERDRQMTHTSRPMTDGCVATTAALRRRARSFIESALPAELSVRLVGAYYSRWRLRPATTGDEPDLRVAAALLRPGDDAVDGGANVGRYSIAFARAVGPQGRILAVEPVPATCAILRRVLRDRRLGHVHVEMLALSDGPGTAWMSIPDASDRGPNLYRARIVDDTSGSGRMPVRTTTLDQMVVDAGLAPTLIKLDLEGHERAAMNGARGLLESGAAWLLEVPDDPDRPDSDAAIIIEEMQAHGYAPRWFDASSDEMRPRSKGETPVNLWFLRPEHLSTLDGAGLKQRSRTRPPP